MARDTPDIDRVILDIGQATRDGTVIGHRQVALANRVNLGQANLGPASLDLEQDPGLDPAPVLEQGLAPGSLVEAIS